MDKFKSFLINGSEDACLQLIEDVEYDDDYEETPPPYDPLRKIILVEDIPNLKHEESRSKFQKIIKTYLKNPRTRFGLVLISSNNYSTCQIEEFDIYEGSLKDEYLNLYDILKYDVLKSPRTTHIE